MAPSVFQRTLENLLAGIPNVCIFLDDILVTGKTGAEHMENLRLVLQRLQNAGLEVEQVCFSCVLYLSQRIQCKLRLPRVCGVVYIVTPSKRNKVATR